MYDKLRPAELFDEDLNDVAGGRTPCEPTVTRTRKVCKACKQFVFRERIDFKPVTGTPWDDEFEMGLATWRCTACGNLTTEYAPIAKKD